jgi:hypothetical protein
MEDHLRPRADWNGCLPRDDSPDALGSQTTNALMGTFPCQDLGSDLTDVELVSSIRATPVDAAQVLERHHVKASPAPGHAQKKTRRVRIAADLVEGYRRHTWRHPISHQVLEPELFGADVRAQESDDPFGLTGEDSVGITAVSQAINHVASHGVGEGRHIAQKLALVVVRTSRKLLLVLKLPTFSDGVRDQFVEPGTVDLAQRGAIGRHGSPLDAGGEAAAVMTWPEFYLAAHQILPLAEPGVATSAPAMCRPNSDTLPVENQTARFATSNGQGLAIATEFSLRLARETLNEAAANSALFKTDIHALAAPESTIASRAFGVVNNGHGSRSAAAA